MLGLVTSALLAALVAPPAVMMNGLPGAMGREIAAACLRRGIDLVPYCLTGPGMPASVTVDDVPGGETRTIEMYPPDKKDELAARVLADYPDASGVVAIDFTHPTAVNSNAEWYCEHGIPFVMGTTGGDRDALLATADGSRNYCVIAPNMAKQIVALQAALEYMAESYPAAFGGYTLSVTESHQATKADTSGTAKAIAASLASATGAPFANDQIVKVRETKAQLAGGGESHRGVSPVPDGALGGHAFHTYSLVSADGLVEFQARANLIAYICV